MSDMKIKEWKEPEHSPKVSVDILIVKNDRIILLTRKIDPFKGKLILPGGMVEYGETVESAAVRETEEETGLNVKVKGILGVYSDPKRDPRFHSITTAFITEPIGGRLKSSFEGMAQWYDIDNIRLSEMGFDHAKILSDYIKWRNNKGTYWSTKK